MILSAFWLLACMWFTVGDSSPGLTIRIWDIRVTPHDLPTLEPGPAM